MIRLSGLVPESEVVWRHLVIIWGSLFVLIFLNFLFILFCAFTPRHFVDLLLLWSKQIYRLHGFYCFDFLRLIDFFSTFKDVSIKQLLVTCKPTKSFFEQIIIHGGAYLLDLHQWFDFSLIYLLLKSLLRHSISILFLHVSHCSLKLLIFLLKLLFLLRSHFRLFTFVLRASIRLSSPNFSLWLPIPASIWSRITEQTHVLNVHLIACLFFLIWCITISAPTSIFDRCHVMSKSFLFELLEARNAPIAI